MEAELNVIRDAQRRQRCGIFVWWRVSKVPWNWTDWRISSLSLAISFRANATCKLVRPKGSGWRRSPLSLALSASSGQLQSKYLGPVLPEEAWWNGTARKSCTFSCSLAKNWHQPPPLNLRFKLMKRQNRNTRLMTASFKVESFYQTKIAMLKNVLTDKF